MFRAVALLVGVASAGCTAGAVELARDGGDGPDAAAFDSSRADAEGDALVAAPTCSDGVENGAESDVDCGGCCAPCGPGKGCSADVDCASGWCHAGTCAVPSCTDGVQNEGEIDVDCGGAKCPACASGDTCKASSDCQSRVCVVGVCAVATCTDGAKNGVETDVDCGGATCPPCVVGRACAVAKDCASSSCVGGVCVTPTCTDGVENGDETDVDCGGSCAPCPTSKRCDMPSDCQSDVCTAGACVAATCADGVRNGSESDVDCGGSCPVCAVGERCASGTDCVDAVCGGGTCALATCSDAVKNGTETGVDCGGSCPACPPGQGCGDAADCSSQVCTASVCAAPACNDGVKNGTESSVDCGGACPGCGTGLACGGGADCTSRVCVAGACTAPTCSDGVANGDETDVDCGGSCHPCAQTHGCVVDADCATGACHAGRCAIPRFDLEAARDRDMLAGSYSSAVGDLNGDGLLDFVQGEDTASGTPNVAIVLNAGHRQWAAPVHVDLPGDGAVYVVLTDVDGDGDLDLVTDTDDTATSDVALAPAYLSILLNDGHGNFGAPTSATIGYEASLTIGDLDHDGRPELVTCTMNTPLTVYSLGLDATLTKQVEIGTVPAGASLVDLDGDGWLDVVAATDDGLPALAVYRNLGALTFSASPSFYQVGGVDSIAFADFDEDGKTDLIATEGSGGYVFLTRDDWTFAPKMLSSLFPGESPMTVADVNGDGHADVLIAFGNVDLWLGNGDGTFEQSAMPELQEPTRIFFDDFDGDCQPDIVYADWVGTLNFLPNRGNHRWPEPPSTPFGPDTGKLADVNGDGHDDVVMIAGGTEGAASTIEVWKNLGARQLAALPSASTEPGVRSLDLGDLDGDEKIDLVGGSTTNADVYVWHGVGDGTFTSAVGYASSGVVSDVRVADVDGDGKLDVVAASSSLDVFIGVGDGTLAPRVSHVGAWEQLAIADFDGDGDLDIIGAAGGASPAVYLNVAGAFSTAAPLPTGYTPHRIAAADLDGDGRVDVVGADLTSHVVVVYRNLGKGTFAAPVAYATGPYPDSVALADMDGDGRVDILVMDAVGYVDVFLARGGASFDAPISYATAPSYSTLPTVLSGDLDDDGMVDVVPLASAAAVLWNASDLATLACPAGSDAGIDGATADASDGASALGGAGDATIVDASVADAGASG